MTGAGRHPLRFLLTKLARVIKNDYTAVVNSSELKRWLAKQGATFRSQTGSHLKVLYQGRQSILPMHGKKELPKGLVSDIKKQLGLNSKE